MGITILKEKTFEEVLEEIVGHWFYQLDKGDKLVRIFQFERFVDDPEKFGAHQIYPKNERRLLDYKYFFQKRLMEDMHYTKVDWFLEEMLSGMLNRLNHQIKCSKDAPKIKIPLERSFNELAEVKKIVDENLP